MKKKKKKSLSENCLFIEAKKMNKMNVLVNLIQERNSRSNEVTFKYIRMFGGDEADPLISRDEIISPKNRLDVTNYKFHKKMIA